MMLTKARPAAVKSKLEYRVFHTPAGLFVLMRDAQGNLRATWAGSATEVKKIIGPGAIENEQLVPSVSRALTAYFRRQRVDFRDVPTPKGPEFHRRCWEACRTIPAGQTRTYAELAVMAGGTAKASRAAGQAMRSNPLPVIVPCHRVIGSNGRLHGYAGSQVEGSSALNIKQMLLRLEGVEVCDPQVSILARSRRSSR